MEKRCDNCKAKMVYNSKDKRWECKLCGKAIELKIKIKKIPTYVM